MPHRTHVTKLYILTEIARYIDFLYTSSGWFDWTEPSLTTSLQGIEGVQGALVRGGSSTSNILELHPHRDSKVLLHEFGVVRLDRTFSDYISLSLSLSLSLRITHFAISVMMWFGKV